MAFIKRVWRAVFQSKVCEKIVDALDKNCHVEIITQDCFYKELDARQKQLAIKGEFNFDHPGIN